MNIEIKNLDNGYDFIPWSLEKLGRSIELSLMALEKSEDKDIRYYIEDSLRYMLKMYFVISGKEDFNKLQELFIRNNASFFKTYIGLAVSNDDNAKIEITNPNNVVYDDLLKLITPEDNKTALKTMLRQYKYNGTSFVGSWIYELDDDLEKVYMQEETWEWFYLKHKDDKTIHEYFTYKDLEELANEKGEINYGQDENADSE